MADDAPEATEDDDVTGHVTTWNVDALMALPPSGVTSPPPAPRPAPARAANGSANATPRFWRRKQHGVTQTAH